MRERDTLSRNQHVEERCEMFGFFAPRYARRMRHRERRRGLGRQLFWGLLVGPWLFRRVRRYAYGRRREWDTGYRRGGYNDTHYV